MKRNHFNYLILIVSMFIFSGLSYAQAIVEVKPLEFDAQSLQERNIQVLTNGQLQRVTPNNISTKLRGSATVVERLGDSPHLVSVEADSSTYALPYAITRITPRPPAIGAVAPPPPPTYQPFVKVMQAFRFESAEMAHLAQIALYVVEVGGQHISSIDLPDSVEFTIAAEEAEQVIPERIRISRTNQYKTAKVMAVSPGENFQLKVVSAFNPEGDTIPIGRVPLDMSLTLSKKTILGRGLETSELYISVPNRLLEGVDAFVTLSVEEGGAEFEQSRLLFDGTGSAQTKVRSIGAGTATIVAQLHPFDETASVYIKYHAIWRWFIWVLAGAFLGSVLGILKQSEKQKSFGKAFMGLAIGILVGVGATFAYSQGMFIDVFRVPTIAAELGAFTISFLFSMLPQRLFKAASGNNLS